MVEVSDLTDGDEVKLSYAPSGWAGRQTLTTAVKEVMGDVVYLENPLCGYTEDTLVVDDDRVVWMRDADRNDALFGANASVEEVA